MATSGDVVILIGALELTNSPDAAFGGLEIRVGDNTFPSKGWSDFVLPILPWIAGAVATAKSDGVASAPFMSGQFTLRLQAEADGVRSIGLVSRPGMSDRRLLDATSTWDQWNCALDVACSDVLENLGQLGFAQDSEAIASIVDLQHRLTVA